MSIHGNCPMGCGQTLFVNEQGYITCCGDQCPRRDAVTDLLHDSETEHIIMTDDKTYSVMHPLRERLDRELLTCDFGRYLDTLERPPVAGGRWRVIETGDSWAWFPADR